MRKKDSADELATELLDRVERLSTAVAEDILGSDLRPQAAEPTQAERLAYFRSVFFLPDGTPDAAGREAVVAQYGVDQYETIAKALAAPPSPGEVT